jgi:hypothetical protein
MGGHEGGQGLRQVMRIRFALIEPGKKIEHRFVVFMQELEYVQETSSSPTTCKHRSSRLWNNATSQTGTELALLARN